MFDPEHLSFSGTLQRRDGNVMIIRRVSSAHSAPAWEHPFCGSPRPAEPLINAVRRCVERDLGIHTIIVEALLPTLGKRMNSLPETIEVHPSYVVTSDDTPILSQECEARWVDPLALGQNARRSPHEYSPLLALHAAQLPFFGESSRTVHPIDLHQVRAT